MSTAISAKAAIFLALRRFVWVQSHWTTKDEHIEQETRRSQEFAGEHEPLAPLTSASPRKWEGIRFADL